MVHNIVPEGVECIFVRQSEQLGLGHAVYVRNVRLEMILLLCCWLMTF